LRASVTVLSMDPKELQREGSSNLPDIMPIGSSTDHLAAGGAYWYGR